MGRPSSIDPRTGKRFGWVDPDKKLGLEQAVRDVRYVEKAGNAKDDLLDFTTITMPHPSAPRDPDLSTYKPARFHKIIARHLEEVERGDIRQLIFCMPPRHGKSELATRRLAAWFSGRHPEQNIAVAAFNDILAQDFGADVRAIVTSPAFHKVFPKYRLRRGGSAKDNIQTTEGGRMVFVGRGGTLTGRGAHLLLIDDLFKDHEDARSPAVRDQIWNWFTKVAMTRRMGKKLTVITMTRWHSDDVIGRLTDPENPHYNATEAARWKIIRIPAIAEDDDPLGRQPGEALWPDGPDSFDLDFLEQQQRLDPLGFAALYQQRPTVADGVLFRRENIRRYKMADLPEDLRFYCASDHAVGTGQRNDSTVLLKVGVDRQQNIYVVECDWRKMASDVAVEAMLTMASGENKPLMWWAEKGHISKSIGPFLWKRMAETGRYLNLREVNPTGDKEQRAQSIAARVASGKVFIPIDPPWAERAINEMLSFPNGNHDDFVDALAYIGLGLPNMFGAAPPPPSKEPPKFGTLAWVKMSDRWHADQQTRRAAGGF